MEESQEHLLNSMSSVGINLMLASDDLSPEKKHQAKSVNTEAKKIVFLSVAFIGLR